MRLLPALILMSVMSATSGCGQDPAADSNVPGPAADFSFNKFDLPGAENSADANAFAQNSLEAEQAPLVPEAFHGTWDKDRKACKEAAGEMRLVVGPDTLRYHESEALVRRVELLERKKEIDVTAEYRGEGQVWQNERRLKLSRSGDELTVSGDGSSVVRRRCPE